MFLRSVAALCVGLSEGRDTLRGRKGCAGLGREDDDPLILIAPDPVEGTAACFVESAWSWEKERRRRRRRRRGRRRKSTPIHTHLPLIRTHTYTHSLIPGDKEDPGSGTSRSVEEQVGSVVASFLPLHPEDAPSLVLWQEAEDNDDDQNKRGTANGGSNNSSSYNNAPLLSVGVSSMYVRDRLFLK